MNIAQYVRCWANQIPQRVVLTQSVTSQLKFNSHNITSPVTMATVKISKPETYTANLSSFRYQFQDEQRDINGTRNNSKIRAGQLLPKSMDSSVYSAHTTIVTVSLQYTINCMNKWDKYATELNGFPASCFFVISKVRDMLQNIKSLYQYAPQELKFRDIHDIYAVCKIQNECYFGVNKVIWAVWTAAADHKHPKDRYDLMTVLEGAAKAQVIYSIANYKSRKGRKFTLPWTTEADPVKKYRKQCSELISKAISKAAESRKATTKWKQPSLRNYFKTNKRNQHEYNHGHPKILDLVSEDEDENEDIDIAKYRGNAQRKRKYLEISDDEDAKEVAELLAIKADPLPTDEEMLEILEYLDNGEESSDEASNTQIIAPTIAPTYNNSTNNKSTNTMSWNCSRCTYINNQLLPYCEMCSAPKSPPTKKSKISSY